MGIRVRSMGCPIDAAGIAAEIAAAMHGIDLQLGMTFQHAVEDDLQPAGQVAAAGELVRAAGDGLRVEGGPPGCTASIEEAQPDPDVVAYALSLDITQTSDDTLGAQFAQWVTISCRDAP